ncbi:ATP-dependent Clp protease ATP-binding subunit CLPT1, chloroplastic-like isoform X1 [Rhododendron vialii]|uniref:ATP-dependent Clp protease ATP-binding subunit CLPT1, chloroplastic-like isoform X1 n=1 Tax=Rhododendron vialii TaxID=182163 RepID=UPI00265DCFE5|nr:ATP-dependent Clp protease ATP-binding subunit CLPT1, chloroplastic-like isoform X1 [Rhododendron vialii]
MAAHTISALAIPPCCRKTDDYPFRHSLNLHPYNLVVSSLIGRNLSLRTTNARRGVLKHRRPAVAAVSLSLPTEKPERASSEKLPKWSARAIRAFALGEVEAYKLKYPKKGTECLLMGILAEGNSTAAKYLRSNGITYYKVREETIYLLGKSVEGYESPWEPPLTDPAQRAIDWAIDGKLKSGESGEITSTHLLLGIWSEKDCAGHKILEALGFDNEKAKELAKSMNVDKS